MNPDLDERAGQVFQDLFDLTVDARDAALRSRAGDDDSLRNRIVELLGAYDLNVADRFLEQPPVDLRPDLISERDMELLADASPGPPLPSNAGPFVIERLLAEGDSCCVYLAHEEGPLGRQAAVKVLNSRARRREVLDRFSLERRALAAMQHPNIAQFFEAGTTPDGFAFFAMEYVDGLPITTFCEEHTLTTEARLRLFLQACRATAHAHQRGIIHRDLKPSNILVAVVSGLDTPIAKVIDFGVAKTVLASGRGEFQTMTGMAVGTAAYMSPEQLAGDSDAVDTRTDVYSLGLVLFEMLTASRAIRVQAGRVRQPSDQPWRLKAVCPGLGRDLDALVHKATAERPSDRYQSVTELADDVERLLSGLPLRVRKPGPIYTCSKFIRRNRLASAAVVVIVTVAFAVAAAVWRARTERLELAMQLADAWLSQTLVMQRTAGDSSRRAPLVEQLVEQVQRLHEAAPSDDGVRAMLAAALTERGYLALERAEPGKARADFETALSIRRALAGREPRDVGRQSELSLAVVRVGDAAGAQGDVAARLTLYGEALAADRSRLASHPTDARVLSNFGWSCERVSVLIPPDADRLRLLQEQVNAFERLDALAPGLDAQRGLTSAYTNLAMTLYEMSRPFEGAAALAVEHGKAAVAVEPTNRHSLRALVRAESFLAWKSPTGRDQAELASLHVQAVEHARTLFNLDPGDWDSRLLLATTLHHSAVRMSKAGDAELVERFVREAMPHLQLLAGRPPYAEGARDAIVELDPLAGRQAAPVTDSSATK